MKVKKELKPYLLVQNKYVYELPIKAKGFYEILIRNFRKRSFNEKYWANLFPNIPDWTRIYENRIQNQKLNKLVDFHFKNLHRILPSHEKLYRWKLSNTSWPGHANMCLMPYANNKGAGQLAHPRSLISTFVVHCLDSIMALVSISEISRL